VSPGLRTHPFLAAFCLAMALTGALVIALPESRSTSLTLTDLPEWIAYGWAAMCLAGGLVCFYGLWSCDARYEGAGLVALAATQLFSAMTSIAALGFQAALLGTVKNGGLAAGLIIRALLLARRP